MAIEPKTRYTYADLARFPQDNLRREIIDGELVVTAAPATRHQQVVMTLAGELYQYAKAHGGRAFPAPTDVFLSDVDVVEPDVLFVRAEHAGKVEREFVRSAPDVVVEVSSPSTRRLELVRKRDEVIGRNACVGHRAEGGLLDRHARLVLHPLGHPQQPEAVARRPHRVDLSVVGHA